MSTKRETIEDFCDFIENQINVHVHHYIDDFFSTFPEEKEEQFHSPQISEEEIRLLKFIQRHLKIQKRNDTEQGFDKGFNERTLQHERSEVIEAASRLEKMLLSHLPHEQPVGKTDKRGAEQRQENEPLDIDEHIIK